MQSAPQPGFLRRAFEESCRWFFKLYFQVFHRIKVEGMENVPKDFDKLIVIANHASLIDGILVWTYLNLPFKIIVDRATAQKFLFRPFMQNRYTVQLDSMSPYSLKDVVRKVTDGTPLLIFPEGRMTKTGSLMKIYEGTGFAALRTGAHILPLCLKDTYKTIFSRKHPGRKIFAPISITIGKLQVPLSLDHLPSRKRKQEATRIIYRMLSEVYLEAHNRPSTLGREFITKCKENGGRPLFSDATGSAVTYRRALTAAFALGRYLSLFNVKNVGLLLPNLTVTALIFFGLQLVRKVPVFLNYSSGPGALRYAMELADLNLIITSRRFLERIRLSENVFEGQRVVFLEDMKTQIRLNDKMMAFFRSIFPGAHGRIERDEHEETACILFTSGSEGMPKGVCLSHENLITNVHQALSRIDVTENDYFLNALPMFHSFGLTIGTIIPVFLNARAFFYVSPLHYRIVPEMAYEEGCTILCGTNTFLNGYARRANAYDFYSMHYIYCGGEPLSDAVFDQYAKKFGVSVMSGYGATECSPIVSINSALEHEYGTVGKVLPGIEYKLSRVEGIDDRDGRVGKLFVRGKNVMKGYLKNEKANHKYLVEDEGWYDTGDIVEITDDGFLKIVGRLKRFAKISGEMISLTAIEEALAARFGDRKAAAVMSVPDERKGEKLIVITNNQEVDARSVREALKEKGFSDLAVPREVSFMKEIPKLGTGKIDYVKLKEMMQEGPPFNSHRAETSR
ncbi:MAG: Bifunctional protein Aas [Syntrophorhabdaceae bacterium PtaU1.Bin034]|nr:MAG: Bifunctional protein Aas [Syntrophorhabdaceae bacterium PtaU1.Bin034]